MIFSNHDQLQSVTVLNIVKTFDFSTLKTIIPHSQLKERLKDLIHRCFQNKNATNRYTYLVTGGNESYFVKTILNQTNNIQGTKFFFFLSFAITLECQFPQQIWPSSVGFPQVHTVSL